MQVGLIQLTEDLKSLRKGEFAFSAYFQAGSSVLSWPSDWTQTGTYTSLALLLLRPSDSNGNYTIDSPGSPASHLQMLRLSGLHNHVNQLLITYLPLHPLSLSLECQLYLAGLS